MSYVSPTPDEIRERRAQLAPFDTRNERIWLALYSLVLAWQGLPDTYLDVGSGTGAMVNMARKLGIQAYGIDVINGPEHWFIEHDLSKPLRIMWPSGSGSAYTTSPEWEEQLTTDNVHTRRLRFQLITCLEVAEHIPPEASDVLVDTIAAHMPVGGLLIFSAATPGQSGEHHINLQHPWEWRTRLHAQGISYRADYTMQLAHLWGWVGGPLTWLASNVQVFDR